MNLDDWHGDLAALWRRFDNWPVERLKEVVAVTPSGAIAQIVYRD